uniref:Oligopeptide transporter 1 n=1 Tax=Phanerodontia chrysosporium TaxID=2822231 RepID=M9PA61_PHACH|nr:oligopeptide transporter 1 [Phanerodontia chrysosporium]
MPCATFRAWVIGLMWAVVVPGLNQFFFFRFPSISISSVVIQLLSFPMVRLWAAVVPKVKVFGISLNPGPFTVKEHVLITIMGGVGAGPAYATDIVAVQRVFYNQTYNFSYQWLLVMSTQLIGFSVGGIARRFLVNPPSMIWPANLVTCALFNTLHSQQYAGMGTRGGISRERFFAYGFVAAFCWYWVPGYLFQALSAFNWVCWIVPNHVVVNQLFGTVSGLAMTVVTFDWSQIAYIGSPLAVPWWAAANVTFGMFFFFWIICPALYYTNTWYAKYMPISSTASFDNTGARYDVTRILSNGTQFDQAKYEAYSPLFLSTTFALAYGLSFASITATITHTFLYYRKQIWTQARRAMSEQPDIHARLMSKYVQVPDWWYAVIFVSMFVSGILVLELWPTDMPVWALALALAVSAVYIVPIGIITAITNQTIGLNVITELIVGYALPGKPIAMMMFKTWGYISMIQALTFTSDFKLGHYMKIPPRPMFWSQVICSVVAGTVQLGVQSWMFSNINNICMPDQDNGFICPATQVFGTASIVWGVIGPSRQFSSGQIYYGLVFFFIAGFLAPLATWLVQKRFSHPFLRYINWPIVFNGTAALPPATPLNYVSWAAVCFVFNYVVRRRHFSWWTKYNYVLSAALDAGLAIAQVVIFFALEYPSKGTIGLNTIQSWWGNTVMSNTADGERLPLIALADGQTFGPSEWH